MIFNNILCFHEAIYIVVIVTISVCNRLSLTRISLLKTLIIIIICFLEIVFVSNCAVYIFVFIVPNFY